MPDPSEYSGFYADVSVQYPLSEQLVSLKMGHKFYLEANLYVILSEMVSSTPVENQSLADAHRLKKKMDEWFAKVNKLFDPKILVFPIHFDLQ